ncbi:MAG: phosphoribosyltransferase family protein, partial [Saprospiraceae bacterium]
MQILNNKQVQQKIRRLAMEIMERNFDEKSIVVAGINTRGFQFAEMLVDAMKGIADTDFELTNIKVNPASPLSERVQVGMPLEELENK